LDASTAAIEAQKPSKNWIGALCVQMRGEIIRTLSLSPNGLSLAELAQSVGESDLMKVSKDLSDLQHERIVEITGGKFRLSGAGRKAIIKGAVSITGPKGNEPSSKTPEMPLTGVSVAALELHAAHIRERDDIPARLSAGLIREERPQGRYGPRRSVDAPADSCSCCRQGVLMWGAAPASPLWCNEAPA
jgi:hypothetical protein